MRGLQNGEEEGSRAGEESKQIITNQAQQLKESKEVVPLPTWLLISNLKLNYQLARRPDGSFDRNLAEFLDRKVTCSSTSVHGVTSVDVLMDRATGLWSRIFFPSDAEAAPARSIPIFVYFHGGSFAHSSPNSAVYHTVCSRLAAVCRVIAVSVHYRRSPEHRCPAAYDDGFAAVRWLARHVSRWGGAAAPLPAAADHTRCFLVGDSNGGNIAHHVAVRCASDQGRQEISPVQMSGQILVIPMFGGQRRTESEIRYDGKYFVTTSDRDYYWRLFLPPGADRDHPACNIFGPRSPPLDGSPLPPTLLALAELDMTLDWQLAYFDGMVAAGKNIKKLLLSETPVGFFIFPNTPHFHLLMETIKQFVADPSAPIEWCN